jgi:indole-3-glycerol phosphate synthase
MNEAMNAKKYIRRSKSECCNNKHYFWQAKLLVSSILTTILLLISGETTKTLFVMAYGWGNANIRHDTNKNSNNKLHVHISSLKASSNTNNFYYQEDLYGAIHRKEQEMVQRKKQIKDKANDPIQMAMRYAESAPTKLRLAKALRRIYEDPDFVEDDEKWQASIKEKELERGSLPMRRGCFVVDIKRKSLLTHPPPHATTTRSKASNSDGFARFEDAGMVAEAMVRMGADCVFINVDKEAYGGNYEELQSAMKAVRKVSPTAAVVMKDIVVDELQVGMAKNAGADGILLIAAVLGPALPNFLDLCTVVGLEAIVEVHTKNELDAALQAMAQNLLVTNFDRISGTYYPQQAERLVSLFPGSGPIVALACGGIESAEQIRELLCAGYDGVVVGKAIMGNARAPSLIQAVRDRPLLPAEFAGWGLDDPDVDIQGTFTTTTTTTTSTSKEEP